MTIHLSAPDCIFVGIAVAFIGFLALYGLLSIFTESK